jgi:type IV secretory pathway VirB2 component (pilin)
VQLPEFTRSTTLRWIFLVASIFAASQLTDYIETIGAPKAP